MKQVIGLGAGGHAKVVIEILRLLGGYDIIGLLDSRPETRGSTVLGIKVLGDDSLLPEIHGRGVRYAFVGVGGVGDSGPRARLYALARENGFEMTCAVHPQSMISPSAVIGDGPTVMAAAVINADACLADNVIINTGAIVEHDCIIGNHVHVATGARLGGAVVVADGAHIGLGAGVRQGLRIGRNAIVGAGAMVVDNVPDNLTVVGVPAKPLLKS